MIELKKPLRVTQYKLLLNARGQLKDSVWFQVVNSRLDTRKHPEDDPKRMIIYHLWFKYELNKNDS